MRIDVIEYVYVYMCVLSNKQHVCKYSLQWRLPWMPDISCWMKIVCVTIMILWISTSIMMNLRISHVAQTWNSSHEYVLDEIIALCEFIYRVKLYFDRKQTDSISWHRCAHIHVLKQSLSMKLDIPLRSPWTKRSLQALAVFRAPYSSSPSPVIDAWISHVYLSVVHAQASSRLRWAELPNKHYRGKILQAEKFYS